MQPVIKQSDNFAEVARRIISNPELFATTYDEKLEQKAEMLLKRGQELNRIKKENLAKLEVGRQAEVKSKPKVTVEDHGAAKWYGQGRKMGD